MRPLCAIRPAEYLDELVRNAKNGGKQGLKQAVNYRLSKLEARDSTGLFKWVDGTRDNGYFIIMMRGAGVNLVKRFGAEIFIDR